MLSFLRLKNNYSKLFIWVVFIIIGSLGFFSIFLITSSWGISISPDSVSFIAAAKNILNGRGVTVLYDNTGKYQLNLWHSQNLDEKIHVMLWPPLYPALLALLGFTGLNIFFAAKLLNSILFFFFIILFCYIIKKNTSSTILSILTSIILLTSTAILEIFTYAHTEAPFLLFGFLGILFLQKFLENKKYLFFSLSLLCTILSSMSRYSGSVFILTCVVSVIILDNTELKKRLYNSIIFLSIGMLPLIIWFLRLKMVGDSYSLRKFLFHPPTLKEWQELILSMTKWITIKNFGIVVSCIIASIFLLVIISLTVFTMIKKKGQIKSNSTFFIIIILLIFIFLYFVFHISSKVFFEAALKISLERYLSPLFIAFTILIILLLKNMFNIINKKYLYNIFLIILTIFCIFYIYNGYIWSIKVYRDGQGYSQEYFIKSEIVQEVKKIPENYVIYTNAPDIIYLFTERVSYMLPFKYNPGLNKPNEHFDKHLKKLEEELAKNKSIIVFFSAKTRSYLISKEELIEKFNLKLFIQKQDGEIYIP